MVAQNIVAILIVSSIASAIPIPLLYENEIVCSDDVPRSCDLLNHVCDHGICVPFRDVAENKDSLLEANRSEFDPHSVENGEVVDDWPGNDNAFKEPDVGEDKYDDVAREDDDNYHSNEEGNHEEESGVEYRKKRGVRNDNQIQFKNGENEVLKPVARETRQVQNSQSRLKQESHSAPARLEQSETDNVNEKIGSSRYRTTTSQKAGNEMRKHSGRGKYKQKGTELENKYYEEVEFDNIKNEDETNKGIIAEEENEINIEGENKNEVETRRKMSQKGGKKRKWWHLRKKKGSGKNQKRFRNFINKLFNRQRKLNPDKTKQLKNTNFVGNTEVNEEEQSVKNSGDNTGKELHVVKSVTNDKKNDNVVEPGFIDEPMDDTNHMYSGDISNAVVSCITISVLVAVATVLPY